MRSRSASRSRPLEPGRYAEVDPCEMLAGIERLELSMQVEIWSDVVCPWCYIGKRRWESALATFAESYPDVQVDVAYRAFQLDPGADPNKSGPVREAYEKKFGGEYAASQIIDKVTAEAAGEGLAFDMDAALRSNTKLAHRLLVLGEQQGVQGELKERLLSAYFCEGEAIGQLDTLVRLAAEVGIDEEVSRGYLQGDGGKAEVEDQLDTAVDNGIFSVPTFVFNGEVSLPGAHPADMFVRVLEKLSADEAAG